MYSILNSPCLTFGAFFGTSACFEPNGPTIVFLCSRVELQLV